MKTDEEDTSQSKKTRLLIQRKTQAMKRKSKLAPLPVDPKNKDTGESMLDSLPFDLKLDILTRLPAKSLVNSRRVSKMWYSVIRSRGFGRMFSSISSTRPRLIVALSNGLRNSNTREESLTFFFSFDQGDSSSSSLVPNFDLAMPGVTFSDFSGYCTSVHQFLAVEDSSRLRICNPFTEQFFELPYGTKYVGYDPISDQYKALFVMYNADHKVKTLGGGEGWRHIKPPTTTLYTPMGAGVSINGFIFYGAYSNMNPGIVCFDVRSEKLSYIKAPLDVVRNSAFFVYKGKLASTVVNPIRLFKSFDLWVLEDVEKHQWSKKKCLVPLSLWHFHMSFPATNKAGEIIMAPKMLPRHVQPFYIFYYNVETRNIRRVRLCGIGDNQEFRRSYGFIDKGDCHVRIAPHHIESIAFFKNHGS